MGGGSGKSFYNVMNIATGGALGAAKSSIGTVQKAISPNISSATSIAGGNLGSGAISQAAEETSAPAVAGRRRRFGERTQTVFTSQLGIGGMANIARRMLLGG